MFNKHTLNVLFIICFFWDHTQDCTLTDVKVSHDNICKCYLFGLACAALVFGLLILLLIIPFYVTFFKRRDGL